MSGYYTVLPAINPIFQLHDDTLASAESQYEESASGKTKFML
jgi:hypothetical protein